MTMPLPVQPLSRDPVALTGSLPRPPRTTGLATRRVTGVWFGSTAAPPDHCLAGLHGDLTVTRDGDFTYELRAPAAGRLRSLTQPAHIEEVFSLNLSESAGASCVAQLTVGIGARQGVIRLHARYQVITTVTERYCLTDPRSVALLCMETGEHFVMCSIDTPLAALARSHQREFFGIGGQHLLRIDPINGNTIWIGILDLPSQIRSLESAPDGLLYGVDTLGDLYRIQPSNGVASLLVRRSTPSLTPGALAFHDGAILWTTADNRLQAYDLQTQSHRVVVESLQRMPQASLHDRAIAMMPALDGGLFVATVDGIVRLNLASGDWAHTGVRARLAHQMPTSMTGPGSWGGREPGELREPMRTPTGFVPALTGH